MEYDNHPFDLVILKIDDIQDIQASYFYIEYPLINILIQNKWGLYGCVCSAKFSWNIL